MPRLPPMLFINIVDTYNRNRCKHKSIQVEFECVFPSINVFTSLYLFVMKPNLSSTKNETPKVLVFWAGPNATKQLVVWSYSGLTTNIKNHRVVSLAVPTIQWQPQPQPHSSIIPYHHGTYSQPDSASGQFPPEKEPSSVGLSRSFRTAGWRPERPQPQQ